jgi:hypothetical protein
MKRTILLLFGLILFAGMNATKVHAQLSAVAQVSANILDPGKAAQVKYVNSFSQVVSTNYAVSASKPLVLVSENGKSISNNLPNLASFSITGDNKNSFSVSLPSHPLILRSSENENTLQVDGWQSSIRPGKGESQKNIWVVNLGASLKMGELKDKPEGSYSGTYFVTFVYN